MNRSFASDNNAPVAPEILKAIAAANKVDAPAYGSDEWTARAKQRFRDQFGPETDAYFGFNGTGANVAVLASLLRPWEAVLCPETAHLQTDECGAFERFSGSKVIPIPTQDGKLRPADLEPYLKPVDVHFPQPRIVSISQATEYGGVYELNELRALCGYAHERGLYVHVDGARLSNAAAALGVSLKVMTAGIDLLSFGGTKNGLMYGEAFCFLKPALGGTTAPFVQKQAMQLASKMRYIAAQFDALLTRDLWKRYAGRANAMTKRLEERVRAIDGIRITRPVRCNAIFATMDRSAIERAQRDYAFLVWDERLPEVRWMTHWATTEDDVDAFAAALERAVFPK
ncbi:MAG: low specificity L-threonine aldolase [Candidatus Eremiobacteraeota bacterium]|nr:low specificity L-threonine aldolase [Candidatus Eremiobacteraeota bacterium]MBV8582349.1 low specificity L-threonine aldolase [Candidatus Eremiobacteraeota bacterium]